VVREGFREAEGRREGGERVTGFRVGKW